jgi:hypothetical protein
MKWLVRILSILVVLASIAALLLALVLYAQRDQLKARTDMLENYTIRLADEIELEPDEDLEKRHVPRGGVKKEELKRYYKLDGPDEKGKFHRAPKLDPATGKQDGWITEGDGTMHKTLTDLHERAEKQTRQLDKTRIELRETRELLEVTQDDLADAKAEISRLDEIIEDLEEKIDFVEDENQDLRMQITRLNGQIEDLNVEIQMRDDEINKQKDRIADLELHIDAQDKRIEFLEAEVARLMRGSGITRPTTPGEKGTIIEVNTEWAFVVIKIDRDCDLSIDNVLRIQRNARLVGKVRITDVKVEENTAIGDILIPWQQLPIQEGDRVVY